MTDLTKAKIIELVPEIMELKFGCEVMPHEDTDEDDVYTILQKHGNFYQVQKVDREDCGVTTFGEHAGFRILGRPITLADVLRAIAATEGMFARIDSRGTFEHWWTGDVMNASWERGLVWNLALDYDNQTEVTKRFIGSLIGAV